MRSKIGYDNFRVDVRYENCGTRGLVQIGKLGAISKKTTILCKLALLQSLRAKMNDKLAGTMVHAVFPKIIFIFILHRAYSVYVRIYIWGISGNI